MRSGRRILVCVCSLLLMAVGCTSAGKMSNEEGLAAYHAGDYEKAIGMFRQAVTQDGNRAEYYINLGMAQCAAGAYEDAKQSFSDAIRYNAHSVNAYRGMGIAHLELESYKDAVEAFDKAVDHVRGQKSGEYDIIAYRAQAKAGMKDYDGAIADYETLIAADYETEQIYLYLGDMYLHKNDIVAALTNYQKSITINHRDFEKYLNMIEELKSQGFEEESHIVQDAALSVVPQNAEERYYRGLIYLEQGETQAAFAEFEQSYNMGYEAAGYCLGYCYELRGEYEEAELTYQKQLLEEGCDQARLYNQLAVCKIRQKAYNEALVLIEQGLALADERAMADLLWNQAMCYEGKKDYDKAIEVLTEYQQFFPDDKTCELELSYLRSR